MPLRLYDLAGVDPARRFSPYCWRIRMALVHKELSFETIPWRFTDKDTITDSGQSRVPFLVDGENWLSDSWPIANYLENNYPDRPSLFGGEAGRGLSFFYSNVADALVGSILPQILLDIYRHIDAKDRAYFRASREERLGTTLENAGADRDTRIVTIRQSFAALRMTVKAQPFLVARGRFAPTMRSLDHFNGRAVSARLHCSQPTIQSGCGVTGCSTCSAVSTVIAWLRHLNYSSPTNRGRGSCH